MRIALIGYGKMGKAIEQFSTARGHEISVRVTSSEELIKINTDNTDLAIEFSLPETAYTNIKYCLENKIPVL